MRRILTTAGITAVAALLALTAIAVAGRATVNDPNEKNVPDCQDTKVLKGKATKDKTTFTFTTYGKPTAKPCKGNFLPSVSIDANNSGALDPPDCYVGKELGKTTFSVTCTGKRKGPATLTRDGKVWTLSFKTSLIKKGIAKFGFLGHISGAKALDDTPDGKIRSIKVG